MTFIQQKGFTGEHEALPKRKIIGKKGEKKKKKNKRASEGTAMLPPSWYTACDPKRTAPEPLRHRLTNTFIPLCPISII